MYEHLTYHKWTAFVHLFLCIYLSMYFMCLFMHFKNVQHCNKERMVFSTNSALSLKNLYGKK